MKRSSLGLLFIIASIHLLGQDVAAPAQRHKMAVFTPVYLDEAFSANGSYRYGDKSFPRNAIPGLEFYQGVNIATDSLNNLSLPLDVYIYDSKSQSKTVEQQFAEAAANGVELVIVNASMAELGKFADLGLKYKIPVVNATVPNDGNVKKNPYFIITNPTLQTQMNGIYNFIKNNYKSSQVVFLTRNDANENYIRSLFQSIDKTNAAIGNVKYVAITDSAAVNRVITALDKTKPVLFVGGTLSPTVAGEMLKSAASVAVKGAPLVSIVGMPTWEDVSFSKPEYKNMEVIYGTPFYNPKTDAASRNIINYFNNTMYARASDLVFRGYGLTYRFGNLLNLYGKEINANLGSKLYKVFYDYDIQPVFVNHVLNYFENKKIYFIKQYNGTTSVL